jgi:thymidine phosphorylase
MGRSGDESAMMDVAMAAPDATDAELARLTDLLASSGASMGAVDKERVDIASTGGPGSLSTLLAPLFARAMGRPVVKIAVPGRPAGGLDVLASLSGYRSTLEPVSGRRVLDTCGYLHIAAGAEFCPLDASFFTWRQGHGFQAVPNLAICSLLAKKVAAGTGVVVLDVRVGPYGNFGATADEARSNSKRFIAVAKLLGIDAKCVISGLRGPVQPWIGRGEALLALDLSLKDQADPHLRRHVDECVILAQLATGSNQSLSTALLGSALDSHYSMLAAHGASLNGLKERVDQVLAAPRTAVRADQAGRLHIDMAGLREVLVEGQRGVPPRDGATFSDACGLHVSKPEGSHLLAGETVFEVRTEPAAPAIAKRLVATFTVESGNETAMPEDQAEVING